MTKLYSRCKRQNTDARKWRKDTQTDKPRYLQRL